jgi:hypothetical protein
MSSVYHGHRASDHFALSPSVFGCGQLQPDDTRDDRSDADQPKRGRGLAKEPHAEKGSAGGANPRPRRVGRPDRKRPRRDGEETDADDQRDGRPEARLQAREAVRVLQSDRPLDLEQSADDEDDAGLHASRTAVRERQAPAPVHPMHST